MVCSDLIHYGQISYWLRTTLGWLTVVPSPIAMVTLWAMLQFLWFRHWNVFLTSYITFYFFKSGFGRIIFCVQLLLYRCFNMWLNRWWKHPSMTISPPGVSASQFDNYIYRWLEVSFVPCLELIMVLTLGLPQLFLLMWVSKVGGGVSFYINALIHPGTTHTWLKLRFCVDIKLNFLLECSLAAILKILNFLRI